MKGAVDRVLYFAITNSAHLFFSTLLGKVPASLWFFFNHIPFLGHPEPRNQVDVSRPTYTPVLKDVLPKLRTKDSFIFILRFCDLARQASEPIPNQFNSTNNPTTHQRTGNMLMQLLLLLAISSSATCFAPSPIRTFKSISIRPHSSILAVDISDSTSAPLTESADDDDDEEWEYEEFENLTEADFYGSEWKVGTVMDGKEKIEETWCRLIVQEGEFIAVWGDGSKGTWKFDIASQFLSMTKDSFGGWLGKKLWAGNADDFYYLQGTVRGWSPISPANVVGQWQAKRLGIEQDEAGVAPWFEEDEEEDEADESVASDESTEEPETTE